MGITAQRASKQLSENCSQCTTGSSNSDDVMCVKSACLVSMEAHPSIVVLADSPKTEERQSSSRCQLSTPRDAAVTHILVLPTSANASVSATVLCTTTVNTLVSDYVTCGVARPVSYARFMVLQ